MDVETQRTRRSALKHFYQRLENWESFFLSPDDLQSLGIKAFQVGIADDGTLQFDPCFFRPHPDRVLQKYPIDPSEFTDDDNSRTLDALLDSASIWREVLQTCADNEDPADLVISCYNAEMETFGLDE